MTQLFNTREAHCAVVAVLKKRFTNLTAEEVNTLAWDLLEAVAATMMSPKE